jgi:hypothetical protein
LERHYAEGERLPAKSRTVIDPGKRRRTPALPFSSWGFDASVVVLFD